MSWSIPHSSMLLYSIPSTIQDIRSLVGSILDEGVGDDVVGYGIVQQWILLLSKPICPGVLVQCICINGGMVLDQHRCYVYFRMIPHGVCIISHHIVLHHSSRYIEKVYCSLISLVIFCSFTTSKVIIILPFIKIYGISFLQYDEQCHHQLKS